MGAAKVTSHADRGIGLIQAVLFLSPLATAVAPRLVPFFIAIVGFTLVGSALRRGIHWRELLPRSRALAACLLFAAYVLLSAAWSADPLAGVGKGALLIALILITFAAIEAATTLDKCISRRAALAFAAGALLGTLFVAFELLSDGLATRTAMRWLPLLERSPKHIKFSDAGELEVLRPSKLDQNANMAMFHLWPGLLALMGLKGGRRTVAIVLFFVVTAATIAISEHDSSQVAIVGSSIVLLLAWQWRRRVILALAVAWCAAFVLVIPVSFLAYYSGLHFAEWLPKSARSRVILWEFTAEQTLKHPVLGAGVDSTPRLSQLQKETAAPERPEAFIYPRKLGHHAHSIFLQTWSELGAIGAILFAIAGASVAMLILLLATAAQPLAAAAFAAFALVGAFAWGMWQSWFMCAAALLPIYVRITAATVSADAHWE
jgi:O-antigen ligase/polysaccharide polymerase Wzy-like membrane protein